MSPNISYLICATPRSGSYLLCEALASTGVAGRPDEFFLPSSAAMWRQRWGIQQATYASFVAQAIMAGSTPNQVFGAKIMWGYLDTLLNNLRQLPGSSLHRTAPALLAATFPHLHYVWLTRRDTVRQAVSLWKATQTQVWHVGQAQPASQPPMFNYKAIDRLVRELTAHERSWERFFIKHRITPFHIMYEDFVDTYELTAEAIIRFLGAPAPNPLNFGPRGLQRQADALSEQWVQQYHEQRARSWWRR